MRGVRHRAIAREAGVPLAATTYYFKDLSDLIADAFNLYAEETLRQTQDLERGSLAALARHAPGDQRRTDTRAELARALTQQLVAHVHAQVRRREARVLGHAFRNEALRNAKLATIAQIPNARLLGAIAEFLERCGSSDPASDTRIIFGGILEIEYEVLVGAAGDPQIERTVRRLVGHVLRVSND